MNPNTQPYQLISSGSGNSDVFSDISTRSLHTVRMGEYCGKINTGLYNVFGGYESAKESRGTSFSVYLGYRSGMMSSQNVSCTYIGAYCGAYAQKDTETVLIGFKSGENIKESAQNCAIGPFTMRESYSATGVVTIGYRSCERILDGDYLTAVGTESLQDNRSGSYTTSVGFRSGRASGGSCNVYVGSYSGYSNTRGDNNVFVGVYSGYLTDGSYNVALGPYAMQYASGNSNIAIGPYVAANASGSGSVIIGNSTATYAMSNIDSVVLGTYAGFCNIGWENVLIGARTSLYASVNQSVVVGTEAAPLASGTGYVILGHATAPKLRHGGHSIFIGEGADTYDDFATNGIAIGSSNTLTTDNSISIGQDIVNQQPFNVLVGTGLQSDANNSVVVGNDLSIQSVVYFKDPMALLFITTVLADGYTKLGLCNITYGVSNNLLISPNGTQYNNAIAHVITENTLNSINNTPSLALSPSSFDLRTAIAPRPYATSTGSNIFVTQDVDLTSNYSILHLVQSNIDTNTTIVYFSSNETLSITDFLLQHTCNLTFLPSNWMISDMVVNVQSFQQSNIHFPIHVPKQLAEPFLDYTFCNTHLSNLPEVPLQPILLTTDGVHSLGTNEHVLRQFPVHGRVSKEIYDPTDSIQYTRYPWSAFATEDILRFLPNRHIIDNEGYIYGVQRSSEQSNVVLEIDLTSNLGLHTPNQWVSIDGNAIPLHLEQFWYGSTGIAPRNASIRFQGFIGPNSNEWQLCVGSNLYSHDVLQTMVLENMDAYPDYLYASYTSQVAILGQTAVQSNESYAESVLYPLLDPIPIALYDLSNMAWSNYEWTCNISIEYLDSLVTFDQYYSNLRYTSIGNREFVNVMNTYTDYSSNWISLWDPFYTCNETILLQSSHDGFSNAIFADIYPITQELISFTSFSNLDFTPLSNVLVTLTDFQWLHETNLQTWDSWNPLSNAIQYGSNVDYKYHQVPRLFVTLNDIAQSNVSLIPATPHLSNDTYVAIQLLDEDRIVPLRSYSSTLWDGIPTSNTTFVSSLEALNAWVTLGLPSNVSRLEISQYPSLGRVYYDDVLQTISYESYTPLQRHDIQDIIRAVIFNESNLSREITWNVEKPLFLHTESEQTILVPAFSNMTAIYHDSYYDLSNVMTIPVPQSNLFLYTYSSNGDPYSNVTVYVPLMTYDCNIGLTQGWYDQQWLTSSSNYFHQEDVYSSNIFIANYSLIEHYYHFFNPLDLSEITNYAQNTSNWTICNVDILYATSNMFELYGLSSNHVDQYDYYITYTQSNTLAFDVHETYVTADQSTHHHIAAHDPSYYFYTKTDAILSRDASNQPLLESFQIPTMGPILPVIVTSNVISHSNLLAYENVYPVHHHWCAINDPHATLTLSGSMTDRWYFLTSNESAGPKWDMAMSNIDAGNTWLRLGTQDGSVSLQIASDSFQSNVQFRATSNIQGDVSGSPDVVYANMGANMHISLDQILDASGSGKGLTFTATEIVLWQMQYGMLSNESALLHTIVPLDRMTEFSYVSSPLSNISSDWIAYMYASNEWISPVYTTHVILDQTPLSNVQSFNLGLSKQSIHRVDSNIFKIHSADLSPHHLEIHITSAGSEEQVMVTPWIFTMADELPRVEFLQSNVTMMDQSVIYDVYETDGVTSNVIRTSQEYILKPYTHHAFMGGDQASQDAVIRYQQLGNQIHPSNVLAGQVFAEWKTLDVQGHAVNSADVDFIITQGPQRGYFWSENVPSSNLCTVFPWEDVLNHRIHYTPYDPALGAMSNEHALKARLRYQDVVSPEFTWDWKNYISLFPQRTVQITAKEDVMRTISFSEIPKSYGLIQDGITWTPITQQTTFSQQWTWPYQPTSNILTIGSNLATDVWNVVPFAASTKPFWNTTETITLVVDQADRISLVPLLSYISCNVNTVEQIYLWEDEKPIAGILRNDHAVQGVGIVFREEDVRDGAVYYQHLGGNVFMDQFSLRVSSSPYDVSSDWLTVQVQIRPLPRIVKNQEGYIYDLTVNDALTSFHDLSSNVNLVSGGGLSNANILHVLSTNVDVIDRDGDVRTSFTQAELEAHQIGLRLPAGYLSNTQLNAPFDPIHVQLAANQTTNLGYYNTLADADASYDALFRVQHDAYFNLYHHSNVITEPQESLQVLEYTIDPNSVGASNFTDRVVSYFIQVKPSVAHLPMGSLNPTEKEQLDRLRTYHFQWRFIDLGGDVLAQITFQKTIESGSMIIYEPISVNSNIYELYPTVAQTIQYDSWNNVLFVNEDPENDNCASLYIRYDVGGTRSQNQSVNVFGQLGFDRINFSRVYKLQTITDLTHPLNYRDSQSYEVDVSGERLGVAYRFLRTPTVIQYRNQEIFVSTYSLQNFEVAIDNHNVVCGRNIIVRGTNNITLGSMFVTSGQNSIIIGNTIGRGNIAEEGQINDIYQCIILGNESFVNSIIRDVIAVGNRILNNLYLAPIDRVNEFLARQPILIGNDITIDTLDYHLNVGNTFMKTTIGGNQVYLGNGGETVGIGYSSNMYLDGTAAKLHVQGGIHTDVIKTDRIQMNKTMMIAYSTVSIDPYKVVVATGAFIEDAPYVEETTVAMDTRFFGIVNSSREVSVNLYEIMVVTQGITQVWLEPNTVVVVGDLMTTATASGMGKKQVVQEGIYTSYTIGKAMQSVGVSIDPQLVRVKL